MKSYRFPYRGRAIPKKVRCLGREYGVHVVPLEDMVIVAAMLGSDVDGRGIWGLTDFNAGNVYLLDSMTAEKMWLTFCHELAHILGEATGQPVDETFAERIERPFASLLAENDWSAE